MTRSGEPAALVAMERALLDRSTLVAWWITWGCYAYVLLPAAAVCLALAWRFPAWRGRIFFALAMLLLCWLCSDAAQHAFGRPRRADWVVKHETAFSYPSSHAAISTGFYLLWAGMLAVSELPAAVRVAAPLALAAFTGAIWWSRLALGAHYATDLAGGILLASAIVFAGLALAGEKVFGAPAGRL